MVPRLVCALLALLAFARPVHADPSYVQQPAVWAGVCGLQASTTSATVSSLVTCNTTTGLSVWPTASGFAPLHIQVRNLGSNGAAFCPLGGTCTCIANTVAVTNGVALPANSGGYSFTLQTAGANVAYNVPTVVACAGTVNIEVDIQQ